MSDPDNTSKDGPPKPPDTPAAAPARVAHGKAAERSPGETVLPRPPHSDEPMELKNLAEPAPKIDAASKAEAASKTEAAPEPKPAETPPAKKPPAKEQPKSAKADGAGKAERDAAKKAAKKKPARRGRGAFSWFVAGIGLAIAALGAFGTWNVWAEPHYVLAPRLDALMQDYGGYLAAAALFGLSLSAAMVFRRRLAFPVAAVFVILSVVVAAITTVLLGVGAGVMCGREPVFSTASPDRRLLVTAVRGKCGMTRELTYRVAVRELGPNFPREVMIFQSFGKPAPSEVVFSKDRTITVLVTGATENGPTRYTVTIDRKTFKPDKVWRFDIRTD